MMLHFTSLSPLFPSPGSAAFLSWPFWVIWLLKASIHRNIVFFVRIGVCLGLIGLCIFPQNIEIIALLFLIAENIAALFLFEIIHTSPQKKSLISDDWGDILPLLIIGCVFMGFVLHSFFGIILVIGAGMMLLSWWEGRKAGRAFYAWEMICPRLCGMIIALLGVALMESGLLQGSEEGNTAFFKKMGIIFTIFGLAMMVHLGKRARLTALLGMLDTGLRFAALFLLSRLSLAPAAYEVIFIVSWAGFVSCFLQKERVAVFPAFFLSFAVFAASFGDEIALFLSFIASLLMELLKLSVPPEEDYKQVEIFFLPILCVISLMIMRHMNYMACFFVIMGMYYEIYRCDFKKTLPLYGFLKTVSWSAFWSRMLLLLLFIFSLSSIFLLGWHPLLSWNF